MTVTLDNMMIYGEERNRLEAEQIFRPVKEE
ncbi:Uncharacterised protein [Yersinia frederiksenii]|nr:Uncharacterised protein [Yersinia frederiksenii]